MSHPSRPDGPTGEFVRTNSHGPHPFDVAVGRRLRMARKARSLSQGQLAESIGLSSHQQVQKYEQGANRISASSLAKAAIFLGVPIDYFFVDVEGMPLPAKGAADPIAEELAADPRAIALLQAWRSLPAPKRNFFADLIRSAAQEPGDGE
ncbi:helix-turn-helix domain-containing protein [Phenylobacterium sp. J426]|uniref:helix-turn-helix domain-containing protein n=1 Tax=Phenylobacterium sp. J426 TaxID=2898439 RepID=UPI002150A594|nr:helix-turn-helix transcriptional regulator [Phenylobacterium sp. J426]